MNKVIDIRKATVYRGTTRVFSRFSLEIANGDSVAIIGPNGAGKSTLLKLLTREIYPAQAPGSYVRVFGEELSDVVELRSHLGIVSNDLQKQYMGDVKGADVLLSGLHSSIGMWSHQTVTHRERKRAEALLTQLEIGHCGSKWFSEMSAGEQRRLLLGRALIHDPQVLVLDEPTSGLDVKACFQYLEIVRNFIKKHKTVVLVTHHIHEIPPEISRVVLLKAGKVIADGDKTRVLTGDSLARLFDTPVEVVEVNGFYQVMPGAPGNKPGKLGQTVSP